MARCEVCFDPKPFFVLEGRYDERSHVGTAAAVLDGLAGLS
jgi:hypothetical protein